MKFLQHTSERLGMPEQVRIDLLKNLSVMLGGGVPIHEALRTLADHGETGAARAVTSRIALGVESGLPFSQVIARETHLFGHLAPRILEVGEASGSLAPHLGFIAGLMEGQMDLRQEVRGATLYPKFVLTLTVILAFALVAFVIPKLIPVFQSLHVDLPLSTRMLLWLSGTLHAHWVIGALMCVMLILLPRLLRAEIHLHTWRDHLFLKLPLFGSLIQLYELAIFSRMFETLFHAGTPVNESLDISARAVENTYIRAALTEVRVAVEQGAPLARAFGAYPKIFPAHMRVLIKVGEESGTLEGSFGRIAESYEREIARTTKRLPALIEPMMLVVIALLVAFVALSIVMPIYSITSGFIR